MGVPSVAKRQFPTMGCGIRDRNSSRSSVELLGYLHVEGGDRRPEEALLSTWTSRNRCSTYKPFSDGGSLSDLRATLLMQPLATAQPTIGAVRDTLTTRPMTTCELLSRLPFSIPCLARRVGFSTSHDTKHS